jgi:hypothetical protein
VIIAGAVYKVPIFPVPSMGSLPKYLILTTFEIRASQYPSSFLRR